MQLLALDLRHFTRMLRRTPTSMGVAVLTLALTLGVGTALFAIVDAVDAADPWAFGAVALVLCAIAGAAIAGPARRIGRTDPSLVLRGD